VAGRETPVLRGAFLAAARSVRLGLAPSMPSGEVAPGALADKARGAAVRDAVVAGAFGVRFVAAFAPGDLPSADSP
jgi:hypothetical protein